MYKLEIVEALENWMYLVDKTKYILEIGAYAQFILDKSIDGCGEMQYNNGVNFKCNGLAYCDNCQNIVDKLKGILE